MGTTEAKGQATKEARPMSAEVEHTIHTLIYVPELDALWPCIRAKCSCGATWTHQESDSDAERLSIFKSHLAYAMRQATRVD